MTLEQPDPAAGRAIEESLLATAAFREVVAKGGIARWAGLPRGSQAGTSLY